MDLTSVSDGSDDIRISAIRQGRADGLSVVELVRLGRTFDKPALSPGHTMALVGFALGIPIRIQSKACRWHEFGSDSPALSDEELAELLKPCLSPNPVWELESWRPSWRDTIVQTIRDGHAQERSAADLARLAVTKVSDGTKGAKAVRVAFRYAYKISDPVAQAIGHWREFDHGPAPLSDEEFELVMGPWIEAGGRTGLARHSH